MGMVKPMVPSKTGDVGISDAAVRFGPVLG